MDQFNDTYRYGAGSYPVETSIDAGESIAPDLRRMRKKTYDAIAAAGAIGMTPIECSEKTGLERWTVQPRFTELKKLGLIVDSGMRRRNPSGRNAIAWIAKAVANG